MSFLTFLNKKVKISNGLTWTYGYDHRNQLIEVQRRTTDGGTLELDVDLKYDAYGNRLEKTVDSNGDGNVDTTQRYALDGWNAAKPGPIGTENWDVVFDLDGSNNLVTRYLRGDIVDQLFARTAANGDAYWYFGDHLGSIRDITDNTGVVKDTLSYDAFGNIFSESDANYGGRYKWTGREIDQEIDMQYNRARYYDAKIGRWISQDPLGFEAGDSNLYRYVLNRPTKATDPSGLVEADDRETFRTLTIKNSQTTLEKHVNAIITAAKNDGEIKAMKNGPAKGEAIARYVFDRLGYNQTLVETKIERWLRKNLKPNIVEYQFEETYYGCSKRRVSPIAGTIRIHEKLMGTDKWGHFFQQGYWYFTNKLTDDQRKTFGLFLEGAKEGNNFKTAGLEFPGRIIPYPIQFGVMGKNATKIISYADNSANEEGYKFYTNLARGYNTFVFRVHDYNYNSFNEAYNAGSIEIIEDSQITRNYLIKVNPDFYLSMILGFLGWFSP